MSTSAINETFREMQHPAEKREGTTAVVQPAMRKQSSLLKTVTRQINTLERSLSLADRDLLALSMLHTEFLRHAGPAGASQLARLQAVADAHKDRKKSRDCDGGYVLSAASSRRSSDQT